MTMRRSNVGASRILLLVGMAAVLRSASPALAQEISRSPALVFDRVGHVRELPDGTLLVTESLARLLYAVSPQGVRKQIGRTGDGPGEYRSPGRLIVLDSLASILVDNNNRRWSYLQRASFVPVPNGLREANLRVHGVLGGVSLGGRALDVRGHGPLARLPFPNPNRAHPVSRDSVAFVLYEGRERADTIALGLTHRFGAAVKRLNIKGVPDQYNAMHPLATFDQAVLFADGTVALARVEPYRVDWRRANGAWMVGKAVGDATPAVTANMRRELSRAVSTYGDEIPVFDASDFPIWPDRVPPFTSHSVHAGPDGRVYVVRTWVGGTIPRQVDVFDRQRGRVGSLSIPPGARLVGIGQRTLFVALPLETGEEELLRVSIPSFGR